MPRSEIPYGNQELDWFDWGDGLLPEHTEGDVAAAVDALDEKYRAVIEVRVWGQLSAQEACDLLEISRTELYRRWREGLRILRVELGDG